MLIVVVHMIEVPFSPILLTVYYLFITMYRVPLVSSHLDLKRLATSEVAVNQYSYMASFGSRVPGSGWTTDDKYTWMN